MTPPVVSIPSVSGQTSTRTISPRSSSPERMPPWTAAPYPTASSGLIPFDSSLLKYSLRSCWTFRMRVEPLTRTTYNVTVSEIAIHKQYKDLPR